MCSSDLSARSNPGDGSTLHDLVVEPAILSVVCFYLNTERQQRKQSTIDVRLVKLKKPEDIFEEYYRWAIADAGPAVRRFVESALVTHDGQRVLYPVKALEGQAGAIKAGVEKLLARGILRREWLGGEERLEVSHDLLLRPITEAQQEARRARERKRMFMRIALVFLGLSVAAIWAIYDTWERAEAYRNQREAALEATLVATMPSSQGKNEMAKAIDDVHATNKRDRFAAALDGFLQSAVKNASPPTDATRALPTFAAAYAQLEIDRHASGGESYNAVIDRLRGIVGNACRQGLTQPDETTVQWFKQHGGIPAECA